MKRLLLIALLFIVGSGLSAQTPTHYAERYDTANFLNWSDGYDKFPTDEEIFIYRKEMETTVSYFASQENTRDNPFSEFDFPDVIDISSNPILDIELLQPKNHIYNVRFEAIDINGDMAITEQIVLPMSADLKVYHLEFSTNDSVDFKNIDKVLMYKTGEDPDFYRLDRWDVDLAHYLYTDFYIGTISIGKGLESRETLNRNELVLDENNWGLDTTIHEGSKELKVVDGKLVLIDTANPANTDINTSSIGFAYKLDKAINLLNRPFLSIKFKTNQDIKVKLDARDVETEQGYEWDKWNIITGGLIVPYNDVIATNDGCSSIINVDLNIDGRSHRHDWDIFHIDSISSVLFYVNNYDATKPLIIEIEEVRIGNVLEQDFPEVDILDVESYDLQYTGEVLVSSDVESNGKVYLSKNPFFGKEDTILLDFNITPDTDSYEFDKWINLVDATGLFDDRFRIESPFRVAKSYYVVEHEVCGAKRYNSFLVENYITVGLDDQENEIFALFPNPTIDQLTIEDEGIEIQSVNISDVRGEFIKTIWGDNQLIDVSDLERGIYLLQIQTKEGLRQSRFIKE